MALFRTKNKTTTFIQPDLTLCAKGEDILKECGTSFLSDLKSVVSVPTVLFEKLYFPTIKSIAGYCQAQPLTQTDQLYSLLLEQFRFCYAVLKQRRGLLLPQGAGAEKIAEQEPVWTFAFFTTSLLQGLTQLQTDRTLSLFDNQGGYIGQWHSLLANFEQSNGYYKIEWQPSIILSDDFLKGALVKQLIPNFALNWILQTPSIFACWIEALTQNNAQNIITKTIQDVAEKIQYTRHKQSICVPSPIIHEPQVTEVITKNIHNPLTDLGCLLSWITTQQSAATSDAPEVLPLFFKTETGLFVTESLLDDFLLEHSQWENRLELLGLFDSFLIKENDNPLFKFRPLEFDDRRTMTGVVISSDYLPHELKNLPSNDNFISFDLRGE